MLISYSLIAESGANLFKGRAEAGIEPSMSGCFCLKKTRQFHTLEQRASPRWASVVSPVTWEVTGQERELVEQSYSLLRTQRTADRWLERGWFDAHDVPF